MNVLQVVDTLRLGGAERTAVDMVNLLDPDEVDVSLCATREGGPLAEDLRAGVAPVVLARRGRWDPSGMAAFARLVRRRRIDIVHSHGRGSAQFVALCRQVARLPVRHVFHDHFSAGCGDSAGRGVRIAVRAGGIDAYVGVHRLLCDWAVASLGLPRSRVHLIPNGVDLGRFPARLARPGARPLTLAMVAGLRPVKDHPTMLRALLGCSRRADVELVVIGAESDHAYAATCRAMIAELGLGAHVRLVGQVGDIPTALAAADIGVLSSRTESGPIALLEYMAAGLPFVVTDTGELAEAVRGSGAGFLVAPGDTDALAAALDAVIGLGEEGRRAMGARGRALVVERFDQRATVARVAELYRSLSPDQAKRAAC